MPEHGEDHPRGGDTIPEEAEELFDAEPQHFTAARNALAKRLRSEGRREEADRVAALRRPTLTAWALNRVARRQPELIEDVIDAGDRLRDAMQRAMGGDRAGFSEAQAGERAAIQRAVSAGAAALETGGGKDTEKSRQRMTETLRAVAVDGALADQLKRGLLQGDVSAAGFGLEGIAPAATTNPAATAREDDSEDRRREHEALLSELEREKRETETRLASVRQELDEAEQRLTELKRNELDARRQLREVEGRLEAERRKKVKKV